MVLDYALTVSVNQKVPVLIVAEDGFEPIYAQPGDAGADLRSRIDAVVPANSRVLVPTGVSIALPAGYVGLVHPRSGLAHKHGITVLNAPGTVDSGYRGEISVNLFNTSDSDFEITRGDRIAQLVIQKYEEASFVKVERLPDSERGQAGHGSTGKK
jgi:dUTP pyrophosphatase